MAETFSERLSALDATFLDIETQAAPMHVGAALLFEAKPLLAEDGSLDVERLSQYVEGTLARTPRYRQCLEWVPGLGHPVWIDSQRFNIQYHLRHTRLPRTGDERSLKRLVGRLFSQQLDRNHPLWEFWTVEGVDEDSFALVIKVHHCMVDGVGGVELLQTLLSPSPDAELEEKQHWTPRPAPSRLRLLREELEHRARGARQLTSLAPRLAHNLGAMQRLLRTGLQPTAKSIFTETDVSPYRRFDWMQTDLAEAKAIKDRLGGTVNDLIVAATAGGVRRFLSRRGAKIDESERFRVVLPVNTRKHGAGGIGNHVSMLLAALPIAEADPKRRLRRVIEITTELKERSRQADSAELVEELADVTTKALLSELFKTAMRFRSYNLIITNVPGPSVPLYMLGARMKAIYPMVPLMRNQNLGIALFSYCGTIFWGFNADWESFPDVHSFVQDVQHSFEELKEAAFGGSQQVNQAGASKS